MSFLPGRHFFPAPEPKRTSRLIYPLFLPFAGCPVRCVFCAQELQTGKQAGSVSEALALAGRNLAKRELLGLAPLDLAFFGGTFTALDPEDLRDCLAFAGYWKKRGLIADLRCSTRPDALSPALLSTLKAAGLSLVELGVQSFDQTALTRSRRGYSAATARKGCDMVLAAGLELGIQLMPGLPGGTPESAMRDVEITAAYSPSCARLYPCLVIEGTGLARIWREGGYSPWTPDAALDFLGSACLIFWRANVPVIRIGLAEEPGLSENILAGPRHPDLGGRAKGRALYLYIREELQRLKAEGSFREPFSLLVPKSLQGAFWGNRGELEESYRALGLSRANVRWWDEKGFALVSCQATLVAAP